jgi:hypothetical protein
VSGLLCRADLDGHVVDRGVFRQRERVDRFDLLRRGVLEDLRDVDARQESGNSAANFGVTKRAAAGDGAFRSNDFQRAGGSFRSCVNGGMRGPESDGHETYKGQTHCNGKSPQKMAPHTCLREQAIGTSFRCETLP